MANVSQAELDLPVGAGSNPCFAQTYDRRLANGTVFAPTSQLLTLTGIWLPQGQVVTGITFVSGSTAEGTGSNLWYCIYKQNALATNGFTLMAQSTTDGGGASFAANTAFRKALTAPQTCPYTGHYLLGFMCQATQMPTLLNIVAANTNCVGGITGMTPMLACTADAGNTTTAPTTLGAQTAIVNILYAFVD